MSFHECQANPHSLQWSSDRLSERFIGLLERLENCLRQVHCPHYFIQDINLFELLPHERCAKLAGKVQQIRVNLEQVLIDLQDHGEQSFCRKQVLQTLKGLEELNLHSLKSYHLETILFYECEANPPCKPIER